MSEAVLADKVSKRTERAVPEKPPPWKMPIPESGLVVWHFADFSGEQATGLVTKVNQDTIDLMVFSSGPMLPQPMIGCRHVSDPSLKDRTEPNPGGVWELTKFERRCQRNFTE